MNPSYSAQIPKLRPGDLNNQSVLDRLTDHLNSLQLQAGKGISIRRQGSVGTVVEATAPPVSAGGGGGESAAYSGMFAVTVDPATRLATIAAGTLVRCSELDTMVPNTMINGQPAEGSYFALPSGSTTLVNGGNSKAYVYIDVTFDFSRTQTGAIADPTYSYGSTTYALPESDIILSSGLTKQRYYIASVDLASNVPGVVNQLHHGVLRVYKCRSVARPFELFFGNSGSVVSAGDVYIGSVRKQITQGSIPTLSEGLWYVMLDIFYANNAWQVSLNVSKTRAYSTLTNHVVVIGTFYVNSDLKKVNISQWVTSDVYVCGRWVD